MQISRLIECATILTASQTLEAVEIYLLTQLVPLYFSLPGLVLVFYSSFRCIKVIRLISASYCEINFISSKITIMYGTRIKRA